MSTVCYADYNRQLVWYYAPSTSALLVRDQEPTRQCKSALSFQSILKHVSSLAIQFDAPTESMMFLQASAADFFPSQASISNITLDGVISGFKYIAPFQPTYVTIQNTKNQGPLTVNVGSFDPLPTMNFINIDPKLSIVDSQQRVLSTFSIVADCSTIVIVNNEPLQPINCITQAPPTQATPTTQSIPTTTQASLLVLTPTFTKEPTTSSSSTSSNGSTGLIIGIIAAVIVAAIVVGVFFMKRRKQRAYEEFSTPLEEEYVAIDDKRLSAVIVEIHQPKLDSSLLERLKYRSDLSPYWLAKLETATTSSIFGQMYSSQLGSKKIALKGLAYFSANKKQRKSFIDAFHEIASYKCDAITKVLGISLINIQALLVIASEYVDGGSLGCRLYNPSVKINRESRLKMCRDVVLAVWYLQTQTKRRYAGKCINSASFLVSSANRCKLDVFSLMEPTYEYKRYASDRYTKIGLGLAAYVAPEEDGNQEAQDIYALGILCGEILTRERPFAALYDAQGFVQADLILLTNNTPRPTPFDSKKLRDYVSSEGEALLESCWSQEPMRRPAILEMLSFFSVNSDEVSITL